MKAYIVIPHYNKWELTHARLWEIYKYCKNSVEEVLVVDNGSTDEMTNGGMKWWADFSVRTGFKVRGLRTEENIGFLLASNLGMSDTVSKCGLDDVVILLSNDVEVRTDFVKQILEVLEREHRLVGGVLYSHDTGWNQFGDEIYPYLEGWMLAMRSKDWTFLGGFDTRYSPSDYEDVDLSTTARIKYGYELVPLNNPGIHHIGGQSYGYTEERRKRTENNKKKFSEKWCVNE